MTMTIMQDHGSPLGVSLQVHPFKMPDNNRSGQSDFVCNRASLRALLVQFLDTGFAGVNRGLIRVALGFQAHAGEIRAQQLDVHSGFFGHLLCRLVWAIVARIFFSFLRTCSVWPDFFFGIGPIKAAAFFIM